MKDAIGGMGIYMIVIVFIALFTTYVSVTTTYSRCFRVKDEVISVIEHYHGFNEKTQQQVGRLLTEMGYSTTGKCPEESYWNAFSKQGNVGLYGQANYCVAKIVTASTSDVAEGTTNAAVGLYDSAYYQVIVFFRLEWPIFRNIFNVSISGETQVITNPNDQGTPVESNFSRV